jgi:predicted metalloendopeptidase
VFYTSDKLSDSTQKSIFSTVQAILQKENREEDIKRLNVCAIRAEEAFSDMSDINVREEIDRHIEILRSISKVTQRKELESAIRQAERAGDSERLKALMEQYTKLL